MQFACEPGVGDRGPRADHRGQGQWALVALFEPGKLGAGQSQLPSSAIQYSAGLLLAVFPAHSSIDLAPQVQFFAGTVTHFGA